MQDREQRVVIERQELEVKITSLTKFTKDLVFRGLPDKEKVLMKRQLFFMKSYSDVLLARIQSFN